MKEKPKCSANGILPPPLIKECLIRQELPTFKAVDLFKKYHEKFAQSAMKEMVENSIKAKEKMISDVMQIITGEELTIHNAEFVTLIQHQQFNINRNVWTVVYRNKRLGLLIEHDFNLTFEITP